MNIADEGAMNVAMQIVIDHTSMVADAALAYEKVKEIFSKPIALEVKGDTNFGQALHVIQRFENTLKALTEEMEGVAEAADDMAKDTARAMEFASTATDEISDAVKDYQKQLDKLNATIEERTLLQAKATKGDQEALRTIEAIYQKSGGGGDALEKYQGVTNRFKRDLLDIQEHLANLSRGSFSGAVQHAAQAGGQVANAYTKEFQRRFGVTTADLKVLIRAEDLIQDVEKALAGHQFTLGINEALLREQVEKALTGIKIPQVAGFIQAAAQGAVQSAATTQIVRVAAKERTTPQRTRAQDRKELNLKDTTREQARSNPLGYATRHFGDQHEIHEAIRQILPIYEKGLSDTERKLRTQAALPHIDTLRARFNDYEHSIHSSDEKERMRTFGKSFLSNYVTGIARHLNEVRDNGPRRNPKGALAGVDLLGQDGMIAEWQGQVSQMLSKVQQLSGYIENFGSDLRDPWKDALKSLQSYETAVRSFERELNGLAGARETGDQAAQLKRIQTSFGNLNRAEHYLRTNILSKVVGGRVDVPDIHAAPRYGQRARAATDDEVLALAGRLEEEFLANPNRKSGRIRKSEVDSALGPGASAQERYEFLRAESHRRNTDFIAQAQAHLAIHPPMEEYELPRTTTKLPKAEAYGKLTEQLRRSLGGTFDTFNANRIRGGNAALTLREFSGGLFSGNQEIISEFLKLRGASEDVLRDESKMQQALHDQLGPLTHIKDLWASIDAEIESALRLVSTQKDHAAALREDSRRDARLGTNQQARGVLESRAYAEDARRSERARKEQEKMWVAESQAYREADSRAKKAESEVRRLGLLEERAYSEEERRTIARAKLEAAAYAEEQRRVAAQQRFAQVMGKAEAAAYTEDIARSRRVEQAARDRALLEVRAYAEDQRRNDQSRKVQEKLWVAESQAYREADSRAKKAESEVRRLGLAESQAYSEEERRTLTRSRVEAQAYAEDARRLAQQQRQSQVLGRAHAAALAEEQARLERDAQAVRQRGLLESRAYAEDARRAELAERTAQRRGVLEARAYAEAERRSIQIRKAQEQMWLAESRAYQEADIRAKKAESAARRSGTIEAQAYAEEARREAARERHAILLGKAEYAAYSEEESRLRKMEVEAQKLAAKQQREASAALRGENARRRQLFGGGSGYLNTARNGLALFGGFGLGYTAAYQIQSHVRSVMAYQQELANIRGTIGGDPGAAAQVGDTIAANAGKYGVDLVQAAQTARELAEAGIDVNKEFETTLLGYKALGVTLDQMKELQITIDEITKSNNEYNKSVDWSRAVLEKVSVVSRNYATNAQDLSKGIALLSPIMEQFSDGIQGSFDQFDFTIGMITTVVDRLRVSGNQAARSIQMMLSRLSQPEILRKLQDEFGARVGTEDGKGYLPIDQLLPSLANTYNKLKQDSPARATQFAVQLAGGRQVNVVTTLLEQQAKVFDVASTAANAYGDVENRAAYAVETLSTATERLNSNFTLWTKNMADATYFGKGLTATIGTLADAMGGVAGTGAGGLGTLTTILAGGLAIHQSQRAYRTLKGLSNGGSLGEVAKLGGSGRLLKLLGGVAEKGGIAGKVLGGFSGILGGLGAMFGPGTVLIAGLLALGSAIGYISERSKTGEDKLEKYRVKLKSLQEMDIYKAPQMQEFDANALASGLGTSENAYNFMKEHFTSAGHPSSQVLSLYAEFGKSKNLEEVKKFLEENPKRAAEFRTKFAHVFRDELPDDAKRGFDQIQGDAERTETVFRNLGGAAFAANVQIAQAIDGVRDATRKMTDQALKDLDRLDMKVNEKKFLTRLSNSWQQLGEGKMGLGERLVLNNDKGFISGSRLRYDSAGTIIGAERTPEDIYRQLLPNMRSIDGIGAVYESKLGKEVFTKYLAEQKNGVYDVALLQRRFGELIQANPALRQQTLETWFGNIAPKEVVQAAGGHGASQTMLYKAGTQSLYEALSADLTQRTADKVNGQVPEAPDLKTLAEIRGQGAGGKIDTNLEDETKKANRALSAFKDTLLDLTTEFYNALAKFHYEEVFAKTYGTGFDRAGQMIGLGQNLLTMGANYRSNRVVDVEKLQRDLATINSRIYDTGEIGPDGKPVRIPVDQRRREELNKELRDRGAELNKFTNSTLAQILGPDSDVYKQLKGMLSAILGNPEIDGLSLEEFISKVGDALVLQGRKVDDSNKSRIQSLEIQKELYGKQTELLQAQLPIGATLLQRLQLQDRIQVGQYERERAVLEEQLRQEGTDKADVARQIQKLDLLTRQQRVLAAQTEEAKAKGALDEQIRQNMTNALSGVQNLFSNLSIWDAILNPQGNGPEEKARARAAAIGNVITSTISPVFSTIMQRLSENATKALVDTMAKNSALSRVFGAGEFSLKNDLTDAGINVAAIIHAGMVSAAIEGAAMFRAAFVGAGTPSTYITGSGGVIPGVTPKVSVPGTSLNPTMNLKPAANGAEQARQLAAERDRNRQALKMSAAMMVGQIGGTVAGGGGQYAQFGSTAGATIGMLIPGAGPFGAAIGGVLGGFLGGQFDSKKNEQSNPVVKGLDAIERAQRETIETIKIGNDALLKPENRLLNLPATFTVPAYAPNFGGGGSGRSDATMNQTNQITINVSGGNPDDLRSAVEEALSNALEKGRSRSGWGRGAY